MKFHFREILLVPDFTWLQSNTTASSVHSCTNGFLSKWEGAEGFNVIYVLCQLFEYQQDSTDIQTQVIH